MESKVEKVKVVLKKSLKILSLAPDLVCLYFDGPHKESLIGIWEKNREKTKGKVDHLSEIHQIHDFCVSKKVKTNSFIPSIMNCMTNFFFRLAFKQS